MAGPRGQGDVVIRERIAADDPSIAALNDAAFGGRYESKLVAELRQAGLAAIELVAEEQSEVVGHILFSALSVVAGDRSARALALAPMSVRPLRQRSGIGSALVRRGLDVARDRTWQAVIVVGHADYYPRFGFSPALARRLRAPFSGASFMAIELQEGALGGNGWRVDYPAAFGVGEA